MLFSRATRVLFQLAGNTALRSVATSRLSFETSRAVARRLGLGNFFDVRLLTTKAGSDGKLTPQVEVRPFAFDSVVVFSRLLSGLFLISSFDPLCLPSRGRKFWAAT